MRTLPFLLAAIPPLFPIAAHADTHGVTIVNTGADTIRRIEIGNAENRLRSQVPPGASARITYSTGCTAEIRLSFDAGRTETFPAIDICSDPRLATGQGVVGHGTPPPASTASPSKRPSTPAATPVAAPPPIPPWTGHSITKRFGGMD